MKKTIFVQILRFYGVILGTLFTYTQQVNAQGYIDCATHLNSSFDYLYSSGNSYSKTVNGFTYFAAGYNYDPAFPPSYPIINGNPYDPTHTGGSHAGYDVYVAIWDPNCNQIFGTFIGGDDNEKVNGLDLDSEGNLIITGFTESGDWPTTDGTAYQGTSFSKDEVFILKYATDGTLLFSTVFGDAFESTFAHKVLVDGTDIYVFGTNQSPDFPTTNSTGATGYLRYPFVRKYDGSGNLIFSSTWGGDDSDHWPRDFTVLETGGVAVTGYTWSNNGSFPTTDGSVATASPSSYMTILDSDGDITFSTIYGDSGDVKPEGITSDGSGGIYVSGEVWGSLSTTDGTSNVDFRDIYIRKYDLSGNLIFSTLLAGSAADNFEDIQFSNGSLYFMGNTSSSDFPTTDGTTAAGGSDIVLAKYDPNGNLIYSTLYGSSANDSAPPSLEVNASGEIYLFNYVGASPPTTDGTSGSGFNIAKFNSDGSLCASTVLPFGCDNYFATDIEASGDTVRIVGGVCSGDANSYSTDGTINTTPTTLNLDLWVAKYVFCPPSPTITSDILSPATVNVCQNGIIEQIIGEEHVIDGTSLPPVYIGGILSQQPDIELVYQWQTSNSPGGPWTDIQGPIGKQQNYTPAPTTINTYYQRLTKMLDCCGGTTVSTSSNVVSILVSGNTAPIAHAGSTFYTCSGSAVTIGGSPAATGGTSPYTYDWNDGAYMTPNPSVSPTESTIYDLLVTDDNGCQQADQASVIVYTANAGTDVAVCDGAGVLIGGTALQGVSVVPFGSPVGGQYGIAYYWSPTTNLSCSDCPNPTATPASSTDYTLTVTLYQPDGSSCQTVDMVRVDVLNAPSGSTAISDTVLCLGEMAELGSLLPTISEPAISLLSQSSTDASLATIANLTDGDFSTGGHTNDGETENITIDFGSVQPITKLILAPLTGQTIFDRLYVELSTDNVTFNEIANYSFGLTSNTLTTIEFDAQDARYIRLRSGNSFRDVSISEFYAIYDYKYIWTPGTYLSIDGKSATFDAGNLEMPILNPVTYTVTTNLGTCNFYDQVTVAVIEARADEDYCGPRTVGEPDRTPNIEETYSWVKITNPSITTGTGDFLGVTNEAIVPVSASVGGNVGYELTVSYTLNGSTGICKDTVIVPPTCGPNGCDIVTDDGGCPDFDAGTPTIVAVPGDNNPDNWTYSWTSNMGMVGLNNYNSQTVMLTDNVTRTYTVTLTSILDPTYSCSETIEANSASFAEPTFSSTTPIASCAGTPVNIGNPANNPGLTYAWSNGHLLDNATISYPLATVNASTNFTVTVTDNVTGCKVENTVRVEIPQVAYAGQDLNLCDNGTVTIGNAAVAGYTYSWEPVGASWQNGTGPTDAQPDVLVTTTTDFYLTVTDGTGTCTTRDTITVTVETLPPSFTLPDLSYCPSQVTDLVLGTDDGTTGGTNQVPTGYEYVWSPTMISDASAINPTVNTPLPSTATTFEVFVSTPGGCNQRATQNIIPTVPTALVASNHTICLGETTTIGDDANTTGSGEMYSWSPSTDLNNASAINPIFTPSAVGSFTYTLTKTVGGCSTTKDITITVNDITAPVLTPQIICAGESVQIGTTNDPTLSYSWSPTTNLDNAFIANPTFSGTTSTNYTLTVVNGNGCAAQISTRVTVNPAPVLTITLPDTTICNAAAASTVIDASVSPTGTYAYQWSPTTYLDAPNALTPTFFIPAEGNYEYILKVMDQSTGCNLSDTTTLNVLYDIPMITASSSSSPTTCGGSEGSITLTLSNVPNGTYTINYMDAVPSAQTFNNVMVTNGVATITGLSAGMYNDLTITIAGCTSTENIDITIIDEECFVGVGNLVFLDLDNDGIFNNSDLGIDHVEVWLFNAGDDPSVDMPIAKDTTSGGGYYLFDNIMNGQYFLHIPSTTFTSGQSLNNTLSSPPEGTDNGQDDNADENGQNTMVAGGVSSTTIDLQPNTEPTGETGSGTYTGSLDDDHVNLTVDFGFFTCRAAACGTVSIQINN